MKDCLIPRRRNGSPAANGKMAGKKLTDKKLEKLVGQVVETYKGDSGINFIDAANLPVRGRILEILDSLFEVLFPGHTGNRAVWMTSARWRGRAISSVTGIRKP